LLTPGDKTKELRGVMVAHLRWRFKHFCI